MRPGCEPEDVAAHIVNLNVEMERAAAEARAIRAREAAIRERELPHYADAVATEAAETARGFNLATGRVPSVRCGVETESARCSSR